MNDEIKRIIIDEGHYTEANYPFKIKPNFSTLGSIIEICDPESVISFKPNDSIGSLLGFNKRSIYEEYNLSDNPVDILSFDNIFLECNISQVMLSEVDEVELFIILQWMLIQGINILKNYEEAYSVI